MSGPTTRAQPGAARAARPSRSEQASAVGPRPEDHICDYLLVKLATRCNMDCTYCYWFRDDSVRERPPTLTPRAESALVHRLGEHVERYGVRRFFILFHGGEPLLFPKRRFDALCRSLRALEDRLGFELRLALTTNSVLIDDGWASLLAHHRVGVTVSVDGPRNINDARRLDLLGRGTFDRVMRGVAALRRAGIEPGFLAVCDPSTDPEAVYRYFVDELGTDSFDVLVPDATHEDEPAPIAGYYQRLFDLWYDEPAERQVSVRYIESLVKGLLGADSGSESIGYGPTVTRTVLTDGAVEPLDVLRSAGYGATRTDINLFEHDLQAIQRDPLWLELFHASLELPPPCQACPYRQACGGGHIASRWSTARRFDNPSVYCEDLKAIFGHAWARMSPDLRVLAGGQELAVAAG